MATIGDELEAARAFLDEIGALQKTTREKASSSRASAARARKSYADLVAAANTVTSIYDDILSKLPPDSTVQKAVQKTLDGMLFKNQKPTADTAAELFGQLKPAHQKSPVSAQKALLASLKELVKVHGGLGALSTAVGRQFGEAAVETQVVFDINYRISGSILNQSGLARTLDVIGEKLATGRARLEQVPGALEASSYARYHDRLEKLQARNKRYFEAGDAIRGEEIMLSSEPGFEVLEKQLTRLKVSVPSEGNIPGEVRKDALVRRSLDLMRSVPTASASLEPGDLVPDDLAAQLNWEAVRPQAEAFTRSAAAIQGAARDLKAFLGGGHKELMVDHSADGFVWTPFDSWTQSAAAALGRLETTLGTLAAAVTARDERAFSEGRKQLRGTQQDLNVHLKNAIAMFSKEGLAPLSETDRAAMDEEQLRRRAANVQEWEQNRDSVAQRARELGKALSEQVRSI